MENISKEEYKDKLKALRRERQIKNFYMKRIKDGKSRKAVFLDNIILKAFIGLFLYLFVLLRVKKWILSLVISIILFSLYLYINNKIRTKRYLKKVQCINEEIGNTIVSSKINNLNNKEFIKYNKEILEKYYETNLIETNKESIDLVGEIQGYLYGIKAIKTNFNNRINSKDLEVFFQELKKEKIKKAIIITNTNFTEEVIESIDENIKLVDYDNLIELLKKVGLYPSKDEIEDLIHSQREEKRKKRVKDSKNYFVLGKLIRYFILAIVLWLLSYFVSYSLYYRFMSIFLIIFSLIGLIGYIIRLIKKKKEIILHK